jgi:hypothetical protein
MISSVRNVASNEPAVEVWKYLRLFLNPDRAIKRIREIHAVPVGAQDSNLKKQAIQIGYCLRQAEQYFRASAAVGLATKPLLLYYGCVALSRALVLTNKDGAYSLDVMRKMNRHRHHGLVLDQGRAEKVGKTTTANDFFAGLRCQCFFKEDGTAWGHFPLFYESLHPSVFVMHTEIREANRTLSTEHDFPMTCADSLPLAELKGHSIEALQLLRYLPDLYRDMREMGMGTSLARGNLRRRLLKFYKPAMVSETSDSVTVGAGQAGKRELDRYTDEHNFFIDGIGESDQKTYWKFLSSKNPKIKKLNELPANLHLNLTSESNDLNKAELGYYPDIVEDINGKKFYILAPENYIPEPASMLALLFSLGMLSRYYPDIWMRVLEKNVDVVEVTNGLLATVTRKFPNLILDQMSGIKHFIHL